jgi:hypothetical protein
MELLLKSIPMWMNVLESHYLNYSQNISSLPGYFFSSNDVSLNSPSSYELQHSIQFTIQDMKYEIPLTLYDSVEELTEIFMKVHQLPKQYKIMILNKLYYEQNKMFQLVFQSYTHLENEKNYFFLQFLQMEEKAFLSEMHSNQLYEYIQSIENLLPLIQQKLSIAEVNRREQKGREMNEEIQRGEEEEVDDEEHDQLEEHFPHLSLPPHLHKNSTPSSTAAAAVQPNLEFHKLSKNERINDATNNIEIISPKNKKRPPSPASYNLSNSKTQNWKILYEQSMNDLKETKKEKDQLSKDLQYHLNNSVKSQQIQQLTMENQSFKELTTSMKAEILSLQEQIGEIQKSAIQAVKQLQREQQQHQHGKDEEKDENVPRSKLNNNSKYDQDAHEEADYSRDMFEIYREHQQKTLSFASPLSSPSISPRAMGGGSNQNNNTTNNRNNNQIHNTNSSSLIGPSLDDHQNFDEWKKLPFDKRDWTVNYYDLIFNPSYSLQENSLHLFSLFHSLRWPFMEEFLFTIIYQHYSVPTKGGVTLTSFIRFTKDFNIFMNFNGTPFSPASMTSVAAATTEQLMYGTNTTSSGSVMMMNQLNTNSEAYNDILAMSMQSRFRSSSASHSPLRAAGLQPTATTTSATAASPFLMSNRQQPPSQPLEMMSAAPTHITMEPGLSNGEISLIFTNVSRLETDDALKKTQTPVFKVRSVFTPNTINMTEAILGSPISTSSKKGGGILSPVVTLSSPNLSKKINTKNTTAVVNSSSVTNNTIISRKQFILALQEMANKLYCNVIEMAMGNILPSGSGGRDFPAESDLEEEEEKKMKKQKEVERVAMELFLMKVVVPSVVNLGN